MALCLVRGTGDVSSAVAHVLFCAGHRVVLHDDAAPTHCRRGMAFVDAIFDSLARLGVVLAKRARDPDDLPYMVRCGRAVPVSRDSFSEILVLLRPNILVDARMRKRHQPEPQIGLAPLTIGLGPNFIAGDTTDVAVETGWGEDLGRLIRVGATRPLEGVPKFNGLQHEALLGAILAVLVILVFLRNVRSTMIVSLSIPISIVCAFILLYSNNLTLNTFTLGGLALGVGRLVDDAIVVLENIYRHRSAGESPQEASIKGSGEVGLAVLASTITTIVVFLPVVFITGIARLLFTPLALTVAFSLIASYFVSLTVIPVLSRKYLHPESEEVLPPSPTSLDRMKWRFKGFFERIDLGYQSLLSWALGHRKTVVIAVVVTFLGSLPLYLFIGSEFFPSMDESQFRFIIQLPVGTRLEESARISARMEEVVREAIGKEITAVQVNFGIPTGVSAIWSQNTGPHMGWIRVRLVDPGDRELSSDALMEKLRPRLLQEFPGVRIFFVSGGIVRMLISFGYDNPIDVEILGYDFKAGQRLADQVAAVIRQTPGAKDVRISREPDYPQQNIVIDRERASLLGLSVAQVARAIQTFINGYQASIFSDPQTGNQYYITVRAHGAFSSLPSVPIVHWR